MTLAGHVFPKNWNPYSTVPCRYDHVYGCKWIGHPYEGFTDCRNLVPDRQPALKQMFGAQGSITAPLHSCHSLAGHQVMIALENNTCSLTLQSRTYSCGYTHSQDNAPSQAHHGLHQWGNRLIVSTRPTTNHEWHPLSCRTFLQWTSQPGSTTLSSQSSCLKS